MVHGGITMKSIQEISPSLKQVFVTEGATDWILIYHLLFVSATAQLYSPVKIHKVLKKLNLPAACKSL